MASVMSTFSGCSRRVTSLQSKISQPPSQSTDLSMTKLGERQVSWNVIGFDSQSLSVPMLSLLPIRLLEISLACTRQQHCYSLSPHPQPPDNSGCGHQWSQLSGTWLFSEKNCEFVYRNSSLASPHSLETESVKPLLMSMSVSWRRLWSCCSYGGVAQW